MSERAAQSFASSFERSRPASAGWTRYQDSRKNSYSNSGSLQIEGRATRRISPAAKKRTSHFKTGERIFHQKFGYGSVTMVDGDKLTVGFEKAGEKKVLDGFVEKA